MKYVNYSLVSLFVVWLGVWIFNNIHAWAGIGVIAGLLYFWVNQLFKLNQKEGN